MSVATLRFTPWATKSHVAPTKYVSLISSVLKILSHTISLPEDKLDVTWARNFVGAYVQDCARHALQVLDAEGSTGTETNISSHELSIRALTLQLAGRLAQLRDGLDVTVLVDLAVAYGLRNTTTLGALFGDAFRSTPALLDAFRTDAVPAFAASLEKPTSTTSIRNIAHILLRLFRSAPEVVALAVDNQEFVLALARAYHAGLDDLATSCGGMKLDMPEAWHKDWLYAKTGLLDAFHAIIQTLLQSKLPKDVDRLFGTLFAILGLPSSSDLKSAVSFVSRPLLSDYQYAFDLSSGLTERFRGIDDARVDLLSASLAELSPVSHGAKPAGALSVLLKDRPRVRSLAPASESKGKAKAVEQVPKRETELDLAVSQVMDIFPDYTPQHIRRCLQHSTFDGNPEKLISALLEGNIPLELVEDVGGGDHVGEPQKQEFEFIKDRRNIWDDDAMDFSKLRIGKSRDDADALLQDRSFIEKMKADIIRRAEEPSDEEEETVGESRERIIAFEDELDDGIESLVDKGVKIAGDGEESDDVDGEGDEGDATGPPLETILELAYLADPKVFDRDGATRRSKPRAELKAKTGWGDEQIEGWRIMLERNPKKDKILQKHEFAGNVPLAPNTNAEDPEPSGSSRGGTSHRGRGGSGKGRGRGGGRGGGEGGSSGDSARGRAWKDKNKARSANHNRKRGHDKKMARGGGGAPI